MVALTAERLVLMTVGKWAERMVGMMVAMSAVLKVELWEILKVGMKVDLSVEMTVAWMEPLSVCLKADLKDKLLADLMGHKWESRKAASSAMKKEYQKVGMLAGLMAE